MAAAACFVGARLLARETDTVGSLTAKAVLATLGTVLGFALVNLVIADHFAPAGQHLRLEFSGNFARDMSYTIAWSLFAIGLLVAGIRRQLRPARYAAIALLCVTIAKLIFHDLWHLDAIYRISAAFAVGVVTFAVSFLYQRFFRTSDKHQP